MKAVQELQCCFKWVCVIVAFSMAGYWIHKYLKNEDITLIEYIRYRDSNSIHLPAMSICFANTFLINNGSLVHRNDSMLERYLKYLQGNADFNVNKDSWVSLFDQNSWKLSDYLENITIYHYLKNKHHPKPVETFSSLKDCPFITLENNFNGFMNGTFGTCFEMKVKLKFARYVRFVILGFKKEFESIIRKKEGAFVRFSYPGQLFQDFVADQFIWQNPNDTNKTIDFKMDSMELLRRRNKANKECLEDSTNHDKLWLKHVIQKTGCKLPYHNLQADVPICEDYDKLAVFDLFKFLRQEFPLPCEETPHVSFKVVKNGLLGKYGLYPMLIAYPKKIKIITQQQAIDIHALIGNIGGYIGLFLGKDA